MTDSLASSPPVSGAAPIPGKTDAPDAAKKPLKKPAKPKRPWFVENIAVDIVDEVAERTRMKRVFRVVQMQVVIIMLLTAFLIIAHPSFKTIYLYYAVDSSASNRRSNKLLALYEPNMTNQAILSWATNSITEIMTFGFGDYKAHLRSQSGRFTPGGWESFVNAFEQMKLGQTFRERQLVLTTVPSDTAVIVKQGYNPEHVYEWEIQMPVVMTYTTNDNMTHRDHAVIQLTISRVPVKDLTDHPNGIAIKTWTLA